MNPAITHDYFPHRPTQLRQKHHFQLLQRLQGRGLQLSRHHGEIHRQPGGVRRRRTHLRGPARGLFPHLHRPGGTGIPQLPAGGEIRRHHQRHRRLPPEPQPGTHPGVDEPGAPPGGGPEHDGRGRPQGDRHRRRQTLEAAGRAGGDHRRRRGPGLERSVAGRLERRPGRGAPDPDPVCPGRGRRDRLSGRPAGFCLFPKIGAALALHAGQGPGGRPLRHRGDRAPGRRGGPLGAQQPEDPGPVPRPAPGNRDLLRAPCPERQYLRARGGGEARHQTRLAGAPG